MATPTRREFPALLAGLDAPGYARLLAALGRARGEDASVRDGTVVATDDRRIRTYVPPRWLPARVAAGLVTRRGRFEGECDAVATTDPTVAALLRERGVTVVGPEQVRRTLLYGVDRATADALCREHLGRPLDANRRRSVGERIAGVASGPVAVVLVAALLVTTVLAVPLGPLGGADRAAERATTDGDDRHGSGGDVDVSGTERDRALAPGIDDNGIESVIDLRNAHERAIANRSYTWRLTYREYPFRGPPTPTTVRTRAVRVENRTTFHETTTGGGELSTPFVRLPRREVYADGRARYLRRDANAEESGTVTANGTEATAGNRTAGSPANTTGPTRSTERVRTATTVITRTPLADGDTTVYEESTSEYVGWFAWANYDDTETVVRNGTTLFEVTAWETPHPGIDDYVVTALVDRSGFVRELQVQYARSEQEVVVRISFRYTRVGETTVDAPAWYERVRNRTAANRSTGSPGMPTGNESADAGE